MFAGLADAVLCVIRLCLRKVGVALPPRLCALPTPVLLAPVLAMCCLLLLQRHTCITWQHCAARRQAGGCSCNLCLLGLDPRTSTSCRHRVGAGRRTSGSTSCERGVTVQWRHTCGGGGDVAALGETGQIYAAAVVPAGDGVEFAMLDVAVQGAAYRRSRG